MNLSSHKFLVFILSGLFIVALLLRTINLSDVPVGFHNDEAFFGYNAYSLLKTGRDMNGTVLPLSINQYGDFRPAGYNYLTVVSIIFFGLNEFSTRFPAALFGALSVILFYFVVHELFDNKKIALIASIILAIIPWHIVASRASSESILSMFFIFAGLYFYIKVLKISKIHYRNLIYAFILFLISFLFYHAARFFIPLFIIPFTIPFLITKNVPKKKIIALSLFFCSIVLSLVILLKTSDGTARPAAVSIFSDTQTQLLLDEQIREDGNQHALLTRAFHNKVLNYSNTFLENYFRHFTANFLFIKGGLPPRYVVPGNGMLYWAFGFFLLYGVSLLVVRGYAEKKYILLTPILWTLLAVIPSALTWEDIPNIQRSIMMLPGLVIIISYGFFNFFNTIHNKKVNIGIFTIFLIVLSHNFASFTHNYFSHTFTHRPWYRNLEEKQLIQKLEQYAPHRTDVYMTKELANSTIFFLFYLKVDPKTYQKNHAIKKVEIANSKYHLTDHACPTTEYLTFHKDPTKMLFIDKENCIVLSNSRVVDTILRPDGTTALRIMTFE